MFYKTVTLDREEFYHSRFSQRRKYNCYFWLEKIRSEKISFTEDQTLPPNYLNTEFYDFKTNFNNKLSPAFIFNRYIDFPHLKKTLLSLLVNNKKLYF